MTDGTIAGTIAAGVIVFIGVLIKARSVWSSTSKQIDYDQHAMNWQADRQKELDQMRIERNKAWEQRVHDAQRIAQLEGENQLLQHKVGMLETRIAILEGKTP